ncbi:unnamed protein product [Penicillium roqueforti FM164]|uniref:Genomic scaffold, ProqFM164S03 n=1 Tax=Penicillium roqueforti (strain FM164) TaxID=1365484 RepID=W6QD66_PENRF|nr:unnamed protein product [Penicillium roqueforti FM164]
MMQADSWSSYHSESIRPQSLSKGIPSLLAFHPRIEDVKVSATKMRWQHTDIAYILGAAEDCPNKPRDSC